MKANHRLDVRLLCGRSVTVTISIPVTIPILVSEPALHVAVAVAIAVAISVTVAVAVVGIAGALAWDVVDDDADDVGADGAERFARVRANAARALLGAKHDEGGVA